MTPACFLSTITDPHSVITAIDSGLRFTEVVPVMREKYEEAIRRFARLVSVSTSGGDLLDRIRTPLIPADERMALLKIFRRCVSGVCDDASGKNVCRGPRKQESPRL